MTRRSIGSLLALGVACASAGFIVDELAHDAERHMHKAELQKAYFKADEFARARDKAEYELSQNKEDMKAVESRVEKIVKDACK